MLGIAFDSLNEVGDQIIALLQMGINLGIGLFSLVLQPDTLVVG